MLFFRRKSKFQKICEARRKIGRIGEEIAATVLEELGIECLCRNYRYRRGEIDLVCRDDTALCFVEVKTRQARSLFRPAAAVTTAKQNNIIAASRGYLRSVGKPNVSVRYDIVEVVFEGRRLVNVNHIPAAFADRRKR